MKSANSIFAPLLALALLLTHILPWAGASALGKRTDCGCHQAVCCCCQTTPNPSSAPRPAAPARTVTQNDWQMVAAAVDRVFFSADPPPSSAFRACPWLAAVQIPLHQRDCSYLL